MWFRCGVHFVRCHFPYMWTVFFLMDDWLESHRSHSDLPLFLYRGLFFEFLGPTDKNFGNLFFLFFPVPCIVRFTVFINSFFFLYSIFFVPDILTRLFLRLVSLHHIASHLFSCRLFLSPRLVNHIRTTKHMQTHFLIFLFFLPFAYGLMHGSKTNERA
jgi:hypothetical protein